MRPPSSRAIPTAPLTPTAVATACWSTRWPRACAWSACPSLSHRYRRGRIAGACACSLRIWPMRATTWCTRTARRLARSAGWPQSGRARPGGAHVPWLPVPRVPVPGPPGRVRRYRALPGTAHRRVPGRRRGGRGRGGAQGHRRARPGPGHQPGDQLAGRPGQPGRPGRGPQAARGPGWRARSWARWAGSTTRRHRSPSWTRWPRWTGRTCTRSGSATAPCGATWNGARTAGPARPLPLRRPSRRRAPDCCPGSMCSSWPAGTKGCRVRSPRR